MKFKIFAISLVFMNIALTADYFPLEIGNSWFYNISSYIDNINFSGIENIKVIDKSSSADTTIYNLITILYNNTYSSTADSVDLNILKATKVDTFYWSITDIGNLGYISLNDYLPYDIFSSFQYIHHDFSQDSICFGYNTCFTTTITDTTDYFSSNSCVKFNQYSNSIYHYSLILAENVGLTIYLRVKQGDLYPNICRKELLFFNESETSILFNTDLLESNTMNQIANRTIFYDIYGRKTTISTRSKPGILLYFDTDHNLIKKFNNPGN